MSDFDCIYETRMVHSPKIGSFNAKSKRIWFLFTIILNKRLWRDKKTWNVLIEVIRASKCPIIISNTKIPIRKKVLIRIPVFIKKKDGISIAKFPKDTKRNEAYSS